MKWVALSVVTSGLFGSACLVQQSASTSTPPSAPTEVVANAIPAMQTRNISASELYEKNCVNCHGANGEGGGGGTQSLLTKEKFHQDNDKPFFDAIKNGVKDQGMVAFGEALSDKQIWALVVHIRELQAAALRNEISGPKPDANGVFNSNRAKFKLEMVLDSTAGLKTPWAIDWLPDGKALVTNRPGSMVLTQGSKVVGEIEGIPPVIEMGQGGLMEVTVHPDYAKNGWIYLAFTDPKADGSRAGFTKIVRGKLSGLKWTNQETIWQMGQEFYVGSGVHFGCRIVFDRKGHIFFAIGERGNGNLAQDLSKPNGKIYRVMEDGKIPADNPFVSHATALKSVWSYGHRNPQGLVFGADGKLYDTEHAPRGGDELNEIVKGKNYGWPVVGFGIEYSGMPASVPWPAPGQDIQLPIFRWLPSTGACGLDLMKGKAFPEWNGDLIAGGLSGQNVDRVRVKNGKLIEQEVLLRGRGRVRDVAVGPDGFLYVVLNQPNHVVRLVPAK